MMYAIGMPGRRPRIFMDARDQQHGDGYYATGEVAIAAEAGDWIIAADGRTLDPYALPVADRKIRMWNTVKAMRQARLADGFAAAGIGTFDTDAASCAAIAAEAAGLRDEMAAGLSPVVQWKMKDNRVVADIAAAAFLAAVRAIRCHHRLIHYRAQQLGQAIEAAASAEALDAIDIGTGWPEA